MYALRKSLSAKQSSLCNRIGRISMLVLSLLLLYFFVVSGLPFMSQLVGFSEEHQLIIDEEIRAGEWFYIFVDQIREIEPRVRHTLQYTPGTEKGD